jgi:hypothetical protein
MVGSRCLIALFGDLFAPCDDHPIGYMFVPPRD